MLCANLNFSYTGNLSKLYIFLPLFDPYLSTLNESNELEKIQPEAARIVTGATKLVSISSLLSETGWEPFASRRRKHKLAGRPKAALLFWFFGDFRCGALLFMVIHVIYKYKNR